MPFVLDTSVTLSWHFDDEISPYADRVLGALGGDSALAPAIWAIEVANGLAVGERRGRLSGARLLQAVEETLALPVAVTNYSTLDALRSVLALAREYRLTAYDAAYLELAIREGLELATQDEDPRRAATQAGVTLFNPT